MTKKMLKRILCPLLLASLILCAVLSVSAEDEPLPDGIYSARFTTDSSMFSVNESKEGRGILTVSDGEMTIHITLISKSIVNLYPGLAKDAKAEGAELLQPTEDPVTYSDGYQETVYGFDVPFPKLDEEFDLALIGKKGKWYDHRVIVSDPIPLPALANGSYICDVTLTGGSGRASVQSPAEILAEAGKLSAVIVWSSPYYEYMLVDETRYDPVNQEGNSTFVIPIETDTELPVSASTIAMSQPHLIDYTLFFDSNSLQKTK